MDKNAIKKYAVWARTELIARVSMKAEQYGIAEDNMVDASADSVNGKVLSADEKKQRQALIAQIKDKGYRQVMEEVAYTWFNRFSALRFMEVNGYLPSHVRVFTDEENRFKPQILAEAIHLELDGMDMEKVYALKDAEKTDELYRYLLIVQCNALNKILPGMFQRIADYTELLLPDNLLRQGSVIEQMISTIPESDWKDAVQIIGWLYQYYNSEKKDDVFAALKKNVKITKENIPAATQLFTPDWIVRYMVENSLGRLWLEGHPDTKDQLLPTAEEQAAYAAGNRDPEDTKWHYYLEEAEQEPEVQDKLAEIRKEYATLTPEQIKVIDPCCGSGHILAYMFDVLMQIYESYGYTTREAVASIVENNLYGLDIDDRAAQLAYFAVMMKARQYDRRFLARKDEDGNPDVPQPHVYAIVESNHLDKFAIEYFSNGDAKLKAAMDTIIRELHDAKEYGSILTVTPQDWSVLYQRFDEIVEDIDMSRETALRELLPLVQVAEALAQKYDTVVTNPPYMSNKGMSNNLLSYIQKNYPDGKADLFAVFIEKCKSELKPNGLQAMITQHSWMFLSSYEKLRMKLRTSDIVNMAHLGPRAFEEIGGEVVQTTAFVYHNTHVVGYKSVYCRLVEPSTQDSKEDMFLSGKERYFVAREQFECIVGSPFAYWASKQALNNFAIAKPLIEYSRPRVGQNTGDNDRFLRFWHETEILKIGFGVKHEELASTDYKWIPYNKGGSFRRWYGNFDRVVNWQNDGKEIKDYAIIRNHGKHWSRYIQNIENMCREGVSWSDIASTRFACRYLPEGFICDVKGSSTYPSEKYRTYVMAFLNSCVAIYYLQMLNPTTTFQVGNIGSLPFIFNREKLVNGLALENVMMSKLDWDSDETSWDFKHHPLICKVSTIAESFDQWQSECDTRFYQLKANEEELNRIFIDIYGLQDELTPEVEDKDVTVRRADLGRDIRSFISYAVGCMFGRYSLDEPGLAYAGGEWSADKYKTFPADKDNIIPICDDEYFEDDIVGRFVKFVETVYGSETLDENLKFIAGALGGKGQPKDVIRNYFLNDFYNDHCRIYQKRPIYWQFDSGKKNGFKCLIYMHRYQPDTIARIRTDYVHEQQSRYRTAIEDLEQRIASAATSERVKLNKKLKTIQDQASELHTYEEKIHHLADQMIPIDLDDGVKVNYAKFQDVLAKIK
ncbi:MAG: BREX-1 system adenine-specific DNA-methyltransferase PglX [Fusicatenibacter sp.]